MFTKEEITAKGYASVAIIDAPDGALDRLGKALAKASKEGRGTKTLDDFDITFFTCVEPAGVNEYAAFQLKSSGAEFISDYSSWKPQGPADEPGVALYDCWVVSNEINALA